MPGWIQKIGPDGRSVFVPKGGGKVKRVHMVAADIEPYTSPVDGRVVDGRRQRREDLKRNGCVEYDPGMKEEAIRRKDERLNTLTDSMVERMRWFNA